MTKSKPLVVIHVSSACHGNLGPGGYGIASDNGRRIKTHSGGNFSTTDNRMQLTAAIRALNGLPPGSQIKFHTRSRYLQQGITKLVKNWIANGWQNASRDPVKNRDLWLRLVAAAALHEVDWRWVRGFDGHPGSEQAHRLAKEALRESVLRSNR